MSYQECLENAMRIRKVSSPDDECIRLAKGLMKLKRGYDTHAQKKKNRSAILIEDIKPIIVNGFDLFLNKGSRSATSPPTIIDIKYLGYLETLEKNSPIGTTNRLVF